MQLPETGWQLTAEWSNLRMRYSQCLFLVFFFFFGFLFSLFFSPAEEAGLKARKQDKQRVDSAFHLTAESGNFFFSFFLPSLGQCHSSKMMSNALQRY